MSPIPIGSAIIFIISVLFFLQPKRFYFIRHGETILNKQRIRQGEAGALSEKGQEQAARVGQYLKQFSINRIISSTYPRAEETSKIIGAYLHVPITYSPLLVERRNASEVIGGNQDDPHITRITDQINLGYHDDTYRFSDEENFIELKNRARKCLSHLARGGPRATVVITHHVFLKMLIAYALYREHLHAKDFVKLSFFNISNNAGITVCEFHPWKFFSKTHGWEILSYNEQLK